MANVVVPKKNASINTAMGNIYGLLRVGEAKVSLQINGLNTKDNSDVLHNRIL